jgi:hypothetical protein
MKLEIVTIPIKITYRLLQQYALPISKIKSCISKIYVAQQFNESLANNKCFLTPVAKYFLWVMEPVFTLRAIGDKRQIPVTLSLPTYSPTNFLRNKITYCGGWL